MTEQKGKGFQGNRSADAFGYKNTRSDVKYCPLRTMKKKMTDYTEVYQKPKGYL